MDSTSVVGNAMRVLLVNVTFFATSTPIACPVTNPSSPMLVKSAAELLVSIQKTFLTKTSIGTKRASCAQRAGNPSWTGSLDRRATGSTAGVVMTNNSPPDVTVATKSSEPERRRWNTRQGNGTKNVSAVVYAKYPLVLRVSFPVNKKSIVPSVMKRNLPLVVSNVIR